METLILNFWNHKYRIESGEIDQYGIVDLTRVALYLFNRAKDTPFITDRYDDTTYFYVSFILSVKLVGCCDDLVQKKCSYKSICKEHSLNLKKLLNCETDLLTSLNWSIPLHILAFSYSSCDVP